MRRYAFLLLLVCVCALIALDARRVWLAACAQSLEHALEQRAESVAFFEQTCMRMYGGEKSMQATLALIRRQELHGDAVCQHHARIIEAAPDACSAITSCECCCFGCELRC